MKFQKLGGISQVSVEDSLGLHKISEKFYWNFSWNSTYESPLNFGQIATNFRSNGWVFTHEKNQTVSHTDEPSFQPWQWWIKNLLPVLWDESGLKSQPKLNRQSDKRLVKISDQNTQGASRSKSRTESEQNWFSENKTSWLFFPVSSFVICLWTCLLTWVQTTYESTCVNSI